MKKFRFIFFLLSLNSFLRAEESLANIGVITFTAPATIPKSAEIQNILKDKTIELLQTKYRYNQLNVNLDNPKNRILVAGKINVEKNAAAIAAKEKVQILILGFISFEKNQYVIEGILYHEPSKQTFRFVFNSQNSVLANSYQKQLAQVIDTAYQHGEITEGKRSLTWEIPSRKEITDNTDANQDKADGDSGTDTSVFERKGQPVLIWLGLISGKHEYTTHLTTDSISAAATKGTSFNLGFSTLFSNIAWGAEYKLYTIGQIQYYTENSFYVPTQTTAIGQGDLANLSFFARGRFFDYFGSFLDPSWKVTLFRSALNYTTEKNETLGVVSTLTAPIRETYTGWGWDLGVNFAYHLPQFRTKFTNFSISVYVGFSLNNLFDWSYNLNGTDQLIVSASSISLNYEYGASIFFPSYDLSFAVEYYSAGVTYMQEKNSEEQGFSLNPKVINFRLSKRFYF